MYYEQIDPIGESDFNRCNHCDTPCNDTYCSNECKEYDLE